MGKIESERSDDRSLSERVYVALKKSIIQGELHPGYRMIILDIASSFGVSQAPVREAMERLKHEGLLTAEPNRGSMVSHLSGSEMKELYELRELVEIYVLERILAIITQQDLDYLMGLYEEMKKAAYEDNLFKLIELDMEFHSFFYHKYGNQQIIAVWNTVKEKTARFISITNQLYFPNLEIIAEGHLSLIEALKSKDFSYAKGIYVNHMKGVWGRMGADFTF